MKQSDIDKRIAELTKEAQQLEQQRETLAALDVCMKNGHEACLIDVVGDSKSVNHVTLECQVCNAVCHPGSDVPDAHNWMFVDDGFAGMFVEQVYEVEDTAPLKVDEPYKAEPVQYEMREEFDQATGFSRVKMVPKEGDE